MQRRHGPRAIGAALLAGAIALTVGTAGATPPVGSFTPEIIGVGSMPAGFGVGQGPNLSTIVARVTVGPNSSTGWHTHPGKTLVVVQSGELTVYHARGCEATTYGPGDGFVELPSTVHIGRNESATTPAVLGVVFFGAPPGGGPLIDQLQPAGCGVL